MRILGKREILKKCQNFLETQSSIQSPLHKYIFGTSTQKLCRNIKILWFCQTLFDFLFVLKIFCTVLSKETNSTLQVAPVLFDVQSFDIFSNFKSLLEDSTRKIK